MGPEEDFSRRSPLVKVFIRAVFIFVLILGMAVPEPWVLAAGGSRIVINKKTNQLAYYEGNRVMRVLSVATGRKSSYTPEGTFKVVKKLVNPYYSRGKIKGGSSKNPLGARWLGLGVGNTGGGVYGIHGNSNPSSIGTYASSGCIRMYNNEVIWLYSRVPLGTPVTIISKPWDLPSGIYGYVQANLKIRKNGQVLALHSNEEIFSVGGTTVAPLDRISNIVGGKVTAEKDRLKFQKGNRVIYFLGGTKVSVNGVTRWIKPGLFYRAGTAYVPLRWLVENSGGVVGWDVKSSTITIIIDDGLDGPAKDTVVNEVYDQVANVVYQK